MRDRPLLAITIGAAVVAALAGGIGYASAPSFAGDLAEAADRALADGDAAGVAVSFGADTGWATRHPSLAAARGVSEATRARAARAVAAVPGVGGVRWAGSGARAAQDGGEPPAPLHCQNEVRALLRTRSIRFEESSAAIEAGSRPLIGEVATALRPCLGSIIAITGHTDASGTEPGNLALSYERATAVRGALIARGIPADGLRARGLGSQQPVPGLGPTDPANRRIDFAVVATAPIRPTPIDTPGAH